MIPPFIRHQPPQDGRANVYDLMQAQDAVQVVLDEIAYTRRPQLSSEVLTADGAYVEVALSFGVENLVEHGLQREPIGWRLVDIQGPAFVWRVASPSTTDYDATKHLALGCSYDVTVKLEVW